MRNIEAVIFDMDGVLVDSEKFWQQAEYEVFTSLGADVSQASALLTQAMTTREITDFWYAKFPWHHTTIENAENLVIDKVISLIRTEDCGIEGVVEVLDALQRSGFKIGLATNSPARIIPAVLSKFGIAQFFDTCSSSDTEPKGKPNPAVYLTTARKLQVRPSSCLAVEDSLSGMLAAKKAGMKVAAFTNGDKNRRFDIADFHIDHLHLFDFGPRD